MKENNIEIIRDRIDIVSLIQGYLPNLKRAGRSFKACCPFHQEKTPSFHVSPDKGLYYCFGCQEGGDIFDFLMKIEHLSFNEAAKKLAGIAGVEYKQQTAKMSKDEERRSRARKVLEFARDFFHKNLLSNIGEPAKNYLKARKLTKETAEKFELGFALNSDSALTSNAIKAEHKIEGLKILGLSTQYGSDYFRNRLMFPIYNHRGELCAFGGRMLEKGEPKYLNSPESLLFNKSKILYGLYYSAPEIRKQQKAILLEGYMDVISVHQNGVKNCLAPLGTSFTEDHGRLLKRYTNEVVIMFDPDEAGIKASLRAGLILTKMGLFVKVANLNSDLDPDDYIHTHGQEKFNQVVNNAKDLINFHLEYILKKRGGSANLNAQEKTLIFEEVLEDIKSQPDAIVKSEWVKYCAETLNISQQALADRLRKSSYAPRQNYYSSQLDKDDNKEDEKSHNKELDLVKWLIRYPKNIAIARNLTKEYFNNERVWQIFSNILEIYEDNPDNENITKELQEKMPKEENFIIKSSVEPLPKD
ncbi:MAG: DNA primase, partial [Elusimicrobiaceae bacterium]|nr:DNA primase [Elusimicrobiaceae bacterium]